MRTNAQAMDDEPIFEPALGRLCEAFAVLEVIDEHQLLGDLPAEPEARENHQRAVSLLSVLRRELEGVIAELQAAAGAQDAVRRAARGAASKS